MTKNKKKTFITFLCNLCQTFERLRGLKRENVQHAQLGTSLLSSKLQRDNCCFLNEKNDIVTENDKKPKIFQFS